MVIPPVCPANTYAPEGSSICLACPANSQSSAGSGHISQCTCKAGYTGPNGSTCTGMRSRWKRLAVYLRANIEGTVHDCVARTACPQGTVKRILGPGPCVGMSGSASAKSHKICAKLPNCCAQMIVDFGAASDCSYACDPNVYTCSSTTSCPSSCGSGYRLVSGVCARTCRA